MSAGQNNQTLRVGDWYFTPSRNRLSNGIDDVDLEPIASRLLEVLVSEPGRVFSADELVAAVWSDRIVSDNPIYKAMATLRKALGDTSGSPRYVETIRKRGYRLIAEVEAVASTPVQAEIQPPESASDRAAPDDEQRSAGWRSLSLIGVVLAMVAVTVLWVLREAPDVEDQDEPTSGRPMLVVLPFDSDAAFAAPDFLGSGMAQAVAMSLSGDSTFGVIGDTSATLVASRLQDPEEIGASLNARFVLSGVTSQYDDRLVVQVELVDLEVAAHRWAETFEQSVRSGSYVQWRISESLQATLNSWLGQPGQRPEPDRPGRNNLEAYEAFLRGSYLGKQGGVEEKLEAERWLLRALELDDELMPAIAELSAVEYSLVFYGARTSPEALATLRPWIERSMELQPRAAATYVTVGRSKQIQGLAAEAEEAYQTALEIEPDDPSALSSLAWLYVTSNRGNAAVPLYARVLKIDPAAPILHVAAAMNAENLSDYNCSAQLFERAAILKPDMPNAHYGLGQFNWRVRGDFETASKQLATAMSLDERGAITPAVLSLMELDRGNVQAALALSEIARERAPDTYWPRRSRMALAAFTGDEEVALALARRQNGYAVDHMAIRLLRDAALARGAMDEALSVYPAAFLTADVSTFAPGDARYLADIAFAFQQDGQTERAHALARRALELMPALSRLARRGRQLSDVIAAEVLGDRELALQKLSEAAEEGWHVHAWWYLDLDPALADLRASPEFASIRERIDANKSGAGDRVSAVAAAGSRCEIYDLQLPPVVAAK